MVAGAIGKDLHMVLSQMNELGFYTLAGAPKSPRDLIGEVAG